jgi:hypothetical protein
MHSMNWLVSLQSIWQDARFALRTMGKKPAITTTAVLTLALAIGGNTAMFTVIRAVLLKPLQYRDPDRMVSIAGGATPTRFAEMRAGALLHRTRSICRPVKLDSFWRSGAGGTERNPGVRGLPSRPRR